MKKLLNELAVGSLPGSGVMLDPSGCEGLEGGLGLWLGPIVVFPCLFMFCFVSFRIFSLLGLDTGGLLGPKGVARVDDNENGRQLGFPKSEMRVRWIGYSIG